MVSLLITMELVGVEKGAARPARLVGIDAFGHNNAANSRYQILTRECGEQRSAAEKQRKSELSIVYLH